MTALSLSHKPDLSLTLSSEVALKVLLYAAILTCINLLAFL